MTDESLIVAFNPQVVPRGDGSFLVKPGKPIPRREKISITEAVKRYGYSRSTWERLFDRKFIEGERAAPKKILLFVDSIMEHLRASADPEYWSQDRRKRFKSVI